MRFKFVTKKAYRIGEVLSIEGKQFVVYGITGRGNLHLQTHPDELVKQKCLGILTDG